MSLGNLKKHRLLLHEGEWNICDYGGNTFRKKTSVVFSVESLAVMMGTWSFYTSPEANKKSELC